jgi:ribosomal protein S18 acetylase RimI-like enzyme
MNITGKLSQESPGSEHWDQILDFDLRFFSRPWNREAWEDLDWDFHQLFGWVLGEKVIGLALFSLLPGDKVGHLLKIFMEPSHRGRGETVLFWRELTFSLKSLGAESAYLEVEAGNLRAISFYKKIGFQELRRIKSYYSDGADALTMQLTL